VTPAEIVESFALRMAQCLDAMKREYRGVQRDAVDSPLTVVPRGDGDPTRTGPLETLGRFEMHGRGCRFELESGEELDIDWDANGRAVFDAWRILMFARSIGEETVNRDELWLAATEDPSLVKVSEGWFTWADRSYDVTWDTERS
jgi:hypothetical protein